MQEYHFLFKLLLVGQPMVGKSCICSSYSDNGFMEEYSETIGVEFGSNRVKINEKTVKLQIWDTAGQSSSKSITISYYKRAICAIFVFDLTSRESFQNVLNCYGDVLVSTHEFLECCLVGNKLDLEEQRQITAEEAQDFAQKHKMTYFEISAKTRQNLDKPFQFVAQRILERIDKKELDYTNEELGIQMGKYFQNKDEQNNSEISQQFEKQEQPEQIQQPEEPEQLEEPEQHEEPKQHEEPEQYEEPKQNEEPDQLEYEKSDDPQEKLSPN